MTYNIGDELVVIVNDDFGYNQKIERTLKVQVIGIDDDSTSMTFLCYVPSYLSHPMSVKITDMISRRFSVQKKFLGEQGVTISAYEKIARHVPCIKSEQCDHCHDFVSGGERIPEVRFLCRACKENPWR